MKIVTNVAVTDRAAAIFASEVKKRRPGSREVLVLHFMPSFSNADGTRVDGFSPGYTTDYVADRDFGPLWLMARLPDGTAFRFMPKFEWSANQRYIVDQASAYTLSIEIM
jgi:hypothetical protein